MFYQEIEERTKYSTGLNDLTSEMMEKEGEEKNASCRLNGEQFESEMTHKIFSDNMSGVCHTFK